MSEAYNPGPSFRLGRGFGVVPKPGHSGQTEFHPGQDYPAPSGTPIPTASSGTVVYSGFNTSYGNVVIIESTGADGQSYYTLYAHENGVGMPTVGTNVHQGDTIGQVGTTGLSFGAHLHFEVLTGDAPVNIGGTGGSIGIPPGQYRVDPSQFSDWSDGGEPFGGTNPLLPGNGSSGGLIPTDISDSTRQQDIVAGVSYAPNGQELANVEANLSQSGSLTITVNSASGTDASFSPDHS